MDIEDEQSCFCRDRGNCARSHHITKHQRTFAFSLQGLPEADLPTMSTHWILHCLYSLDHSSPDSSRRLRSLIWHDEREQFLTSLQGPQLARLVDFLDQVRVFPSVFCLATNRIPQTLSAISADDDLSRQCLHKLQAICSHRAILPSSYIVSGQLSRIGSGPIAPGAIADVWEGTYQDRKSTRLNSSHSS